MLPRGIEPRSTVLQTVANPSQLEKLGATPRTRTEISPLLRRVPLPIGPEWLFLDSRARFELAVLGLGIPVPFHRPREVGPPPASRTLHAKIRSLCCTSGARENLEPHQRIELCFRAYKTRYIPDREGQYWSFRGESDPIPFVGNERAAPVSESNIWSSASGSNRPVTNYPFYAVSERGDTGHW